MLPATTPHPERVAKRNKSLILLPAHELRALRILSGTTLDEIAASAPVNRTVLCLFELGKADLRLAQAIAVDRAVRRAFRAHAKKVSAITAALDGHALTPITAEREGVVGVA